MEERLNERISEKQRDQLIGRIRDLCNNGVMRRRDWIAMYDIMLEACERDKVETLEEYLKHAMMAGG